MNENEAALARNEVQTCLEELERNLSLILLGWKAFSHEKEESIVSHTVNLWIDGKNWIVSILQKTAGTISKCPSR